MPPMVRQCLTRCQAAPFTIAEVSACKPFIAHSQNKSDGTRNLPEHRMRRFVVGAGNANPQERQSMTNRYLMSVAAAALIAGTGFANAQGTGMSREAPSSGAATTQQSAPPSERGSAATPMNRDSSQSGAPAEAPKSAQSKDMDRDGAKNQRAPAFMSSCARWTT